MLVLNQPQRTLREAGGAWEVFQAAIVLRCEPENPGSPLGANLSGNITETFDTVGLLVIVSM